MIVVKLFVEGGIHLFEYASYTRSYLKIISEQLRDLTDITDFFDCDHPTTFFKISEYFRPNHSLYGLGHRRNNKKYYLKGKSVAKIRRIFSVRSTNFERARLNAFIVSSVSREGITFTEISRIYDVNQYYDY